MTSLVYSSVTLNSFALVRVYFMTKGPLSKSDARVTKSQIKGFKLIANDELGSRCLKGQWGAKCNKQRGGIHGNRGSGNHPKNGH